MEADQNFTTKKVFDLEKPIKENFSQIREIEKQVQEKTGDPKAQFNANLFFLSGDTRPIALEVKYRGKKRVKGGGEEFTSSYKEVLVYATYCPFTGRPLYEEEQEEEQK